MAASGPGVFELQPKFSLFGIQDSCAGFNVRDTRTQGSKSRCWNHVVVLECMDSKLECVDFAVSGLRDA